MEAGWMEEECRARFEELRKAAENDGEQVSAVEALQKVQMSKLNARADFLDEEVKLLRQQNADLQARNTELVLENRRLRERDAFATTLLADISMEFVGLYKQENGVCPVCRTYTHKHWCWFQELLAWYEKHLAEQEDEIRP